LIVPILLAALAGSIVAAVAVGSVGIGPGRVLQIILSEVSGGGGIVDVPVSQMQIVWQIRVPRTLLAAMVGAGLAVVGATMQALVRNPLADPYVLGVSSGASAGATAVLAFGAFATLGVYALSIASFLGALGAMIVVFVVAQKDGHIDPLRLVLGGVAIGYVLSGLTSFLVFQADARASQSVLFWLLGSFGRAQWSFLPLAFIGLVIGTSFLASQARSLNALAVGADTAITLGVDVGRLRRRLFVVVALMTGLMVALAGAIGFVGLILPHLVRMLVGSDHRRLLPVADLVGAIFMVWVDVAVRTVVSPQELPIGVLTAVLGGPVFIWLLRRQRAGAAS